MSAKASPHSAAKPGKDTVYVDVDDEITAIIDKVQSAKQKVVALVLPKRAATLQSIVNMRLLKRSAASEGKSVVLITSEAALLPLAGAAGLHVAKNLQSKPAIPVSPLAEAELGAPDGLGTEDAGQQDLEDQPQKLDYNQPIGALAAGHEEPEAIALDDEDAQKAAAATEVPSKPPKSKSKGFKVPSMDRFRLLLFGGIAALVILIVFFIFAATVLPHATITVTTTSTPVNLSANLTASGSAKTLDIANKVIPSVLKTSDQTSSQQVTATGKQNLGNKAAGSATLVNCNNSAVSIPAGTGISTNGLTYITQSAVAIADGNFDAHGDCKTNGPQASTASVNITAQQGGANYNTSISGAKIAGYSGVTASGSAAGGTDNNVTILQQSDVDGASSKISSSSSISITKTFLNQLSSQGFYVFAPTLKAGDPAVSSNPAVGQQASTATVTIKITYSVLAVQKSDLSAFVTDALNKQIDPSKEKLSDSNVFNGLNATAQGQNQADATLVLTKNSTAVPILDDKTIKAQAAGKKSGDIKTYINTYPGVKNVDVKYSPFFVSTAPTNAENIKMLQNPLKSGS